MVLTRIPRKRRSAALLAAAALSAAFVPAAPASATATAAALHAAGHGGGCVASPAPTGGPALKILDIAAKAKQQYGLNSVILKVTEGRRDLLTAALGQSMTGVPADTRMHFRTGSVGIAYLGIILLQLAEEGVVNVDDPLSRWLPQVPHSDQITLRMLGDSTSGLHDYVSDPVFVSELEARPFTYWTEPELLAFPFSHTLWYTPGTNWSYSHANFVLLGEALAKITGKPLGELLRERILEPLHLGNTFINAGPSIPDPVHAFTSERGTYEESTYWNPSWTTAHGAILTQDICDLAVSARAVGSGELLSPASYRFELNPGTVGLGNPAACPPGVCRLNTEAAHYGLGVQVINGWIVQNPSFFGYFAIQAYLPSQHLSIAVDTTDGPAATPGTNYAQTIAASIAAYLAPGHPLT